MRQVDGLTPAELLQAPLPEQLDYLAPVLHAAEPDMESLSTTSTLRIALISDRLCRHLTDRA